MTLPELVKPTGITTYAQLAGKTGISRMLAYLLWTGKALPGRKAATAISQATGIPLGQIMEAKPNGRANRRSRSKARP